MTDSHLSRRNFLGGMAAAGAGTLLAGRELFAQAKPRLINVHHHLTSPGYVKFLMENKVREFPNKSIAEGLEDMDKAGVTMAFCSTIGPGIWMGNLADTRRLARDINDFAAKAVADHPGKFGMFTMLPLPDIDASLKEIEYGFDKLKADGVYMYTNWGGKRLFGDKYLGDAALAPIYQELQRRKATVYTHPKDAACCEGILPGIGSGTIEYPMDTARSIVSLVYSGTASKYPDVKFIFSHGGGALPYMIGRLTGQQATYLQDGGTLRAGAPAPRTNANFPKGVLYELQKFYYDTASAVNPIAVGGLRKMVPMSQIMFGTDFPFVNSAEQLRLLKECGVFNAKELQAIYYENAGKLLPRAKA